jgi:hypothetical protein
MPVFRIRKEFVSSNFEYGLEVDFQLESFSEYINITEELIEKEIKRAKSLNGYLVVVVESTFADAETYSPYNSFSKKINGAFLFHNIRKLMQENDNVQFVFTGTRKRCMECIDNIFRLRGSAKTLDLEYLKDGGII